MKNKKNLISLIIVLIIVAIILTIVIIINYDKDKYGDAYEKNQDESNIKINYEYQKVNNSTLFYTVGDCAQKYFDYISLDISNKEENQTYTSELVDLNIDTEQEKKQAIYNILDKQYISQNNINLDNIENFINKASEKIIFTPTKMNMLDGSVIQRFAVYGIIDNGKDVQSIYIIVNLDYYNMTYSIEPVIDNKYNNINEIRLDERTEEIALNENNEFVYNRISEESIIRNYISYYKTNALKNSTIAYNLLDEEYREKKFGDIEKYKKYVNDNKEMISSSILNSYQINNNDGYTQYICIDNLGNYYIFKETAIMEYTVILDTYTIDLPEFIEKYNNGTEQQKVALNIEKFMQAINTKDYKYAYNCLADSFKNNYFKTQAEFENYARENFYENSTVEYNQFESQGDIYTYSVILKDKVSGEQKTKTFIMRLGEETDFEMSFNR